MTEQTLYWYKVKNINLTGFSCERPLILKDYEHFDLTTSPDMKETIVISPILIPDRIPEIQRISESAAETLHRNWEDSKEWINPFYDKDNPDSKEKIKTERSLNDMYRKFKQRPFDECVKFVRGK